MSTARSRSFHTEMRPIAPNLSLTDHEPSLLEQALPDELLINIFQKAIVNAPGHENNLTDFYSLTRVNKHFNALAMDLSTLTHLVALQYILPEPLLLRLPLEENQKDIARKGWTLKFHHHLKEGCNGQPAAFIDWLKSIPLPIRSLIQDFDVSSSKTSCPPEYIPFICLQQMFFALPSITKLNLAGNPHIDNRTCQWLSTSLKLNHLNVSRCPYVDDACINETLFPSLNKLEAANCFRLTQEGVVHLTKRAGSLIQLDLSSNSQIDKESFYVLFTHQFLELRTLSLSINQIDDSIIALLPSSCPLLETLMLEKCTKLTDASLQELARGCPYLTTIDLSSCPALTEKGIRTFISSKPALQTIGLIFCSTSAAFITQLRKDFPHLTIHSN